MSKPVRTKGLAVVVAFGCYHGGRMRKLASKLMPSKKKEYKRTHLMCLNPHIVVVAFGGDCTHKPVHPGLKDSDSTPSSALRPIKGFLICLHCWW